MEQIEEQKTIWESNPKLKTLLLVLIGIFLFSGVGLTSLTVWQSYYRQKVYYETEAGLPVHRASKSVDKQISSLPADISNWKTYKNTEYGFEVKYPKDWVFQQYKTYFVLYPAALNPNNIDISKVTGGEGLIHLYITNQNLKEFIVSMTTTGEDEVKIINQEEIKPSFYNATLLDSESSLGYINEDVVFEKSGYSYDFSVIKSTNAGYIAEWDTHNPVSNYNVYRYADIFKEIISTFKFTQSATNISNPQSGGMSCAQVITPARNLSTGEVRDFPTPCDVPPGWEIVK